MCHLEARRLLNISAVIQELVRLEGALASCGHKDIPNGNGHRRHHQATARGWASGLRMNSPPGTSSQAPCQEDQVTLCGLCGMAGWLGNHSAASHSETEWDTKAQESVGRSAWGDRGSDKKGEQSVHILELTMTSALAEHLQHSILAPHCAAGPAISPTACSWFKDRVPPSICLPGQNPAQASVHRRPQPPSDQ